MTTDWAAEQSEAYDDIKEEGFPISVLRPGDPGTWNDETGTYDGKTEDVVYPSHAIKSKRNIVDARGTIVQTDAAVLVIPALGLPIDLNLDANDKLQINAKDQNVTRVNVVDPGNVPIIYEVFID